MDNNVEITGYQYTDAEIPTDRVPDRTERPATVWRFLQVDEFLHGNEAVLNLWSGVARGLLAHPVREDGDSLLEDVGRALFVLHDLDRAPCLRFHTYGLTVRGKMPSSGGELDRGERSRRSVATVVVLCLLLALRSGLLPAGQAFAALGDGLFDLACGLLRGFGL